MRTVTAETTAWRTKYSDLASLHGEDQEAINALLFSNMDMSDHGWIKVGTATITVDLMDDDAIVLSEVETLRRAQKVARADAQIRDTNFERKIQELLAITFEAV